MTDGAKRADIVAGLKVSIVVKAGSENRKTCIEPGPGYSDQIRAIHAHGIKVRLENGLVGRRKSFTADPGFTLYRKIKTGISPEKKHLKNKQIRCFFAF